MLAARTSKLAKLAVYAQPQSRFCTVPLVINSRKYDVHGVTSSSIQQQPHRPPQVKAFTAQRATLWLLLQAENITKCCNKGAISEGKETMKPLEVVLCSAWLSMPCNLMYEAAEAYC